MALEDQLDPGYEVPVVRRAPDFSGGPLGTPYSLAEAERLRKMMPQQATAYRPTPTQAAVDAITRAQRGRSNVTPQEARSRAGLLVGGPGSPLPLDLGLVDFSLLAGSPKWAAEAGYSGGKAAATGEGYAGAALETALAALPIAPTLGRMARGVPDAIDRALEQSARSGSRQSQRGMLLAEKWWTPEEKARRPLAEELETKGASPEDVLVKTGLVRDLDGTWAVEISDEKMKFKALEAVKAAREPIVRRINNIEAAMQMRDIMDRGGSVGNAARDFRVRTGADPSPEVLTLARQRTPQQLEAALENANNSLMAPIKGLKMKDVIEHPELMQRIPELAEMQVDFVTQADLGKNVAGHFDPEATGMGAIRSRAQYLRPSEDYGRSLFAHETQHAIDYASGKDYGISPETIKQAEDFGAVPPSTPAERQESYMRNVGEARARLTQTRLDLTPEERREIFPMREGMMALDRPPEALKSRQELTGGLYGPKQVAGPAASMEPERPLRDVLEDQPYTLRTLENLPGKRTVIPMSEIREQMRRPEVTKAEKDVLERVLARTDGDSISAENLVREVGLETKDFRLAPKDTDEFADYGLQSIGRDATPADWTGGMSQPNAQNARTTIHRSPTPTATNNHFRDPNYFGHTRAFEDAQGIPHVVEIQSDLVQKAGKELSEEERTRLENAFDSVIAQEGVINPILGLIGGNGGIKWASSAANDILQNQQKLLQANPDFLMLLEEEIASKLTTDALNEVGSRAILDNEGDLLRYIATNLSGPFTYPRMQHVSLSLALEESLKDVSRRLSLLGSEYGAKLEQGAAATAQRPMFKNWERRLIREELSRAATPQLTPEYESLRNRAKSALKYVKQVENDYRAAGESEAFISRVTAPHRKDAEDFAQRALEVEKYKPVPSVVRFADADTVAAVEGWERKLDITPGEAMDSTMAGKRLVGSRAGTANDWTYTGNVRVDEYGVWEAERVPIDVTGNPIGDPIWNYLGTSNISEDVIQRFVKPAPGKFLDAGHQGIYDRYKKEITTYLKSLGGKQVKDSKGHGWWEVPVDPKKHKRTPIFSMTGAAVAGGGAAGYNAPQTEED